MHSLDIIQGFDISFSDYSKRIINIKIEDEIIDKLIFPFKKFDITALEYKPFTRFTLAKSLDDSTGERLGKFINAVLLSINSSITLSFKILIIAIISLISDLFLKLREASLVDVKSS